MKEEIKSALREIGVPMTVIEETEALRRDAERYRAMRDAIVGHRLWLYQNGFADYGEYVESVEGVDLIADTLIIEQSAFRRHVTEQGL